MSGKPIIDLGQGNCISKFYNPLRQDHAMTLHNQDQIQERSFNLPHARQEITFEKSYFQVPIMNLQKVLIDYFPSFRPKPESRSLNSF